MFNPSFHLQWASLKFIHTGFFFKKYYVFEFFVNMVLEKGEDCLERGGGLQFNSDQITGLELVLLKQSMNQCDPETINSIITFGVKSRA